jgi:Mg2+ and Co2+ transporter CorA
LRRIYAAASRRLAARRRSSAGADLRGREEELRRLEQELRGHEEESRAFEEDFRALEEAFRVLEADLRGCCRNIQGRLTRLTEELDNSLKFLDLARSMSQKRNVQFLTILATIFLPLSLAAGVLSMQSRFTDLGVLLYDFVGVVVLLVVIALLFLGAMVC